DAEALGRVGGRGTREQAHLGERPGLAEIDLDPLTDALRDRPACPRATVEGQGGVLRIQRGARAPAGRRHRPYAGIGRHEVVEDDIVADDAPFDGAADAGELAREDLRVRTL